MFMKHVNSLGVVIYLLRFISRCKIHHAGLKISRNRAQSIYLKHTFKDIQYYTVSVMCFKTSLIKNKKAERFFIGWNGISLLSVYCTINLMSFGERPTFFFIFFNNHMIFLLGHNPTFYSQNYLQRYSNMLIKLHTALGEASLHILTILLKRTIWRTELRWTLLPKLSIIFCTSSQSVCPCCNKASMQFYNAELEFSTIFSLTNKWLW